VQENITKRVGGEKGVDFILNKNACSLRRPLKIPMRTKPGVGGSEVVVEAFAEARVG